MLKVVIQATVDCALVLAGVFVLVFNAGPMQRPAPVSEATIPNTAAIPSISAPPATDATAGRVGDVTGSIPSPDPIPGAASVPAATPLADDRSCAGNPNALGVSRVVEVDTTGGPGFGGEHFKGMDFLRPGEVVLTFDDGPWPNNTPKVLAALARHCTKAIFFPIGLHATYDPDLLKQVAAAGHTVGSHTWCHQNLSKTKGRCLINGKVQGVEYTFKDEIEKGISAVSWSLGGPIAPFFRFPGLQQPPESLAYLGSRNVAVFSTDLDSFDFKMRRPEQVRQSVMAKLKKHGKGIILMHDFQHVTADSIAQILDDLKAGGYKVVQMRPHGELKTLPEYDAMVMKGIKTTNVSGRPVESVVRTVVGN
jgi:peptidoglycan/xylan/chitin deacetylase (PgdA/CDA1 family)